MEGKFCKRPSGPSTMSSRDLLGFCNIKPLPLPRILSTLLASAIVWCSSWRAYWNRNLRLREAGLGTLTRPFSFFSWLFYCIKNFCNPTMKENRTALWACLITGTFKKWIPGLEHGHFGQESAYHEAIMSPNRKIKSTIKMKKERME